MSELVEVTKGFWIRPASVLAVDLLVDRRDANGVLLYGEVHWGMVTAQEVEQLKEARAEYLERMANVSVY